MDPAPGADEHLQRLAESVALARRGGPRALSDEAAAGLLRQYRYAATLLARVETSGRDPAQAQRLRAILAGAHAVLFRDLAAEQRGFLTRAAHFLVSEVPRTIRSEWRPILVSFAIVYGVAAAAFLAVRADLDLAWSLFDPATVANEIAQLQATAEGEPFRGNFTFGLGQSSLTSGWIMAHNMYVGVVFFASGLVPPLYAFVLMSNGLMLGTYTGVATHWNQGFEISSILWCHGVLEIQALVLAGAAGLVLARGALIPGPWSRRHALRLGAVRAWRLLAPVFPVLFLAGLIEGFVSPHADLPARLAVAALTGVALLAWILLGGRGRAAGDPA